MKRKKRRPKAASEEATKSSKGADEAAAIRAAKAASLKTPEAPEVEAPEEGDPDIVRALLGEPASSRPSVPHTDAVPASTKNDEWVYKPSGNVLIRAHHQPRIKLFTPKDVGDCPVSVCRITPGRTTRVVSQQDGSKEDISDGWAGRFSAHRELPAFWTGITIFRLYSDSEHSAAALIAAGGSVLTRVTSQSAQEQPLPCQPLPAQHLLRPRGKSRPFSVTHASFRGAMNALQSPLAISVLASA